MQIRLNGTLLSSGKFIGRFGKNLLLTMVAGVLFIALSGLVPLLGIQSATVGKHLTFQFLVVGMLCTFIGYTLQLNTLRSRKELEIEQLKTENLQSRYDALVSQINPHFFFNSLSGISSLVQRGNEEQTLDYIGRLSSIFRYTLRTDHRQLATVAEEVAFVEAFSSVMEVRYGGRLKIKIDIPAAYMGRELPVLSFLPLLENVIVHNRIDSSHLMTVSIKAFGNHISVSNRVFPKLTPPDSNGTGLSNLSNRYLLMTGCPVKIEDDGDFFRVYLPLKPAGK